MAQLKISDEQARQLASVVSKDVKSYVTKHKSEFEEFKRITLKNKGGMSDAHSKH